MKWNLFKNNQRPSIRSGIQLERAIFCGNCETVSDVATGKGHCPHCASMAVTPLSGFLCRPRLNAAILDTARRG